MRIGFLGFGKMGRAIAAGIAARHPDARLLAYDPIGMDSAENVGQSPSPEKLEAESDVILLCTKPQDIPSAVKSLAGDKTYISIAAGLSLESIRSSFGKPHVRLARVMPNLPAVIQAGVTGLYTEDAELRKTAREIFEAAGRVVEIPKEDLLHAVTGLSGSGPAFVFAFVQALAEGGVLSGLSYADALTLAAQTVVGSAEMILRGGAHPDVLRNQVTSAGGTTIAGLLQMEERGFHAAVMQAVKAATDRSRELGSK